MSEPWSTIWQAIGELREHKRSTDIRLDRLEKRPRRQPTRIQDLWPIIWGLILIAAVLAGKLTVQEAARLAGGV